MALAAMPRFTSQTPDLTRAVGLVKAAVDPVLASPIVDGKLLTNVSILANPQVVPHGLGRQPKGFFIVNGGDSVTILYNSLPATYASNHVDPSNALLLGNNSVGAVVSLWVF